MPIDFPASPTNGQVFNSGSKVYVWSATLAAWVKSTTTSTYAPLASPALTGTPTAPTAAVGTDTTQVATTAYVNAEIGNDAVVKSLFANKGTIAAASAASTPAALSVGSNGQMLMADSSATAGLRYVDPPANRNLVINGAMQVHQRGTSATGVMGSGYRTADRWNIEIALGGGAFTQSVENDAPTGSGLRKSLKMLVTTAKTPLDATNIALLMQKIEGQDLQRIKKGTASAEQLTLSFWVKANVTGTYIAELEDLDNGRNVSASYTVTQSATWERKTITFPADTSGVLDNDNATSLSLIFWLGAGSNWTSGTLATSWTSPTMANRVAGQTNLAAATNNYWQITGVQLETGPVATPFEFEPYEATLRKCQRYYWRWDSASNSYRALPLGYADTTTKIRFFMYHPVPMRVGPSITINGSYQDVSGVGVTIAALSNNETPTDAQFESTATSGTPFTQYQSRFERASNDLTARIQFSAEL